MKTIFLFVMAGISFGIWPLVMNKSGLPGFTSSALLSGIAFLLVMPVAVGSGQLQQANFYNVAIVYALAAAVIGALGLLAFNTGLAAVPPERVGNMFMAMVMVQLAAPAIYQIFLTGNLSPKTVVAVIGAFVVTYLFTS